MFTRKTRLLVALFLLILGVSAYAGAVGGPKVSRTRVEARSSDRYTIAFYGGEVARIVVDGREFGIPE